MPVPRASVVIATRNRPEMLARCLASVRGSMCSSDELIVVDSASTEPAEVERVALEAGARFFRAIRPGSALARNLGAAHARGSFLVFTDDDAIVDTRWLEVI